MLFYRLQGTWEAADSSVSLSKRERVQAICMDTTEYNGKQDDVCLFVSDLSDTLITLGLITREFIDPIKASKKFLSYLTLKVSGLTVDEITIGKMESLLNAANRYDYIDDDDDILEQFELDKITGRVGRGLVFGENLTKKEQSREESLAIAERHFMTETLSPEFDRIYAARSNMRAPGHPVHYMLEVDDRDTRRDIYRAVLDALYSNDRLESRRYAFLDFRPGENYSRMAYESLYKICCGGAVVVRYLAGDDTKDDDMAGGELDTIVHICDLAMRYRNEVLTMICLPRSCNRVKSLFWENLGSMSFVEIREDFISGEDAKCFLSSLAQEKHVRTDKTLFASLEKDHVYLACELKAVFSEWYDRKLKSTVYPQYKEFASARGSFMKAKTNGSAYDELASMIGLDEVKQVIRKAINYYKMQKLYEEKGIKRDHPVMHMVFSGNPGTAKTTVARLFARIMRENGILPRGHLVEVGRGDLVAKYVGWTAKNVQEKFKAAMGGVLFIDEAYSLVDGRDGSFGDEAINTIVQEMENHRSDVVVILAGYPDKMETFLQKNPGLRSRIAFHLPFADYNSRELCQIAELISKKNGMQIDKGAFDKLEQAFALIGSSDDFGNGRYVRNLFEQAKMNQASRLLERDFDSITTEDITTITADDIVIPTQNAKVTKRQIGF